MFTWIGNVEHVSDEDITAIVADMRAKGLKQIWKLVDTGEWCVLCDGQIIFCPDAEYCHRVLDSVAEWLVSR